MRVKISFTPKVLIPLLFAEIILALASIFVFLKLDAVVQSTLYEFGLQFNDVWAQQYWLYSELILGSLGVATILTCVAMAYIQIGSRPGISLKPRSIGAFIFTATLASAASAFFFTRLDLIVHSDLYHYGLQFSYAWANQYWVYARLLLSFVGLVILLNSSAIGYFVLKPSAKNVSVGRLATGFLSAGGSTTIVLSVILESSILAFIGLGLIFWGAILFYVEPQEYIPEHIAALIAVPPLVGLDEMVRSLGYHGKAFYLPPEYLKDRESSKVYIGWDADVDPTRANLSEQKDNVFLNSPKAVVIEPPGIELSRLFEKTLGTKFADADVQFIQENLPDLIVDDLAIARKFRISVDGSRIHVAAKGLICKNVCKEVRNLSSLYGHIGCPVSSALGCALAKAASKLVTINRELISEDGRNLDVEYVLRDESSE